MKKYLLSIICCFALLSATTINAQDVKTDTKAKKECCKEKNECTKEKENCKEQKKNCEYQKDCCKDKKRKKAETKCTKGTDAQCSKAAKADTCCKNKK